MKVSLCESVIGWFESRGGPGKGSWVYWLKTALVRSPAPSVLPCGPVMETGTEPTIVVRLSLDEARAIVEGGERRERLLHRMTEQLSDALEIARPLRLGDSCEPLSRRPA